MTYTSFCKLACLLHEGITVATRTARRRRRIRPLNKKHHNRSPPVPNGTRIPTSIRLGCALRYFAGGSPYDLMVSYGISHTEMLNSIWLVVEAINTYEDFFIQYPEDHEKQRCVAAAFCDASAVDFDCCAGAIDGILIWIAKPTEKDANRSGIGRKKFFCARKNKFGLNCQAVSDCRGRIVDISMKYGGSSSNCLAFEASNLWSRLEDGLLGPGLFLFGDNAYLNCSYMATPYTNVSRGGKDDYNYYHSQV